LQDYNGNQKDQKMPKDQCKIDQGNERKEREFTQIMGEKLKRFAHELGKTFKNLGSASAKVLNDLDQADKKLQEKMKQKMGSASNY
jgi:hypothetical protein